MAIEKWVAGSGVGFTWTLATTAASLDSLANGNAILGTVAVTNQTSLDIFADVCILLGSAAFVAPNFVGVYIYPLGQDGTNYGDGRFASAAAGPPPGHYSVGNISIPAVTAAAFGVLTGIILPPGSFKFVLWNQTGPTWAASGANTFYYRTYNRSVA